MAADHRSSSWTIPDQPSQGDFQHRVSANTTDSDDWRPRGTLASVGTLGGSTEDVDLAALFDLYDDYEDEAADFKPITEIALPEWVDVFFTLIGVSGFMYKITVEREKRSAEAYQNPYLEVEEFVVSMQFECAVGAVIVFNCIMIGWQASVAEGEFADVFNGFEHCFTLFFFVEWWLRILAFGWVWIFEFLNFADTVLALGAGVLVKWVFEPTGIDLTAFRIMTVLRALRLVRLARAVRLQPQFKEMWILIRGLTTSARPMAWTLLIGFSVLYVFAIAACELIGKNPPFADNDYAQELFGNFFRSMFTMVQLITMDTYCDTVVRPMMKTEPLLGVFFVIFICIGVFIVMNLVTAIIVENAFRIVSEDKDSVAKEETLKKRRELKMLSELFMEIDLDGSGELSKDEFFKSMENKKVSQMLEIMEMKVHELAEVWEVLDDGDGLLTIKEFSDGIRRMKGPAKAKDIADVIKKLKTTHKKHQELKDQARRYTHTLHELERDADEIVRDAQQVAVLFKEMYHRLSAWIVEDKRAEAARIHARKKLEKRAAGEEEVEEENQSPNEDQGEEEDDEAIG